MGIFRIGDQRVGIVTTVPVLDGGGNPTYGDYGEPLTTEVSVFVDNALFEIQTPSELQNLTITTSEIGWAFLPVAGGIIPAVDEDGDPASIAVIAITSGATLTHDARRYVMRGNPVLEKDIRGREDHVFCVCEYEEG
ncbi:conserved hypothetical protein [uncultured Mycobacterium sp.]|uniref:Uncharacterized protein n=1 Tax=uncultured Mycobacterium sp. TaxID=171292 RepID=A0A1Y5P551_9MYCO|nr:conserved hypothetical protein [uncultured Mycobacterium sp.]